MGLFGWLGGAAHSIRHGFGSFGNDVDSIGHTSNIQNASNIGYNVGTSVSRGLINNTWGYNPDGKYDPDRKYGIGTSVLMAKVNTAQHSADNSHVQPSESKYNTTQYKKKP